MPFYFPLVVSFFFIIMGLRNWHIAFYCSSKEVTVCVTESLRRTCRDGRIVNCRWRRNVLPSKHICSIYLFNNDRVSVEDAALSHPS